MGLERLSCGSGRKGRVKIGVMEKIWLIGKNALTP
jgi:hypothetical protein